MTAVTKKSGAAGRGDHPRPGDRLALRVESLASEGEGVGRHDGLAVFVPLSAPGDLVRARVERVRPRYARAVLEDVLEPSPDRTPAPCPVFGACGGCAWQHVSYEAQLRAKEKAVRDALERIGGFGVAAGAVSVRPILGMRNPWHYRNKAAVPVGRRDGRLVAGYYARGSHEIVDFDDCLLEDRRVVAALRAARDLIEARSLEPYDEVAHRGLVRHMVARVARATGEVLVTLVLNGRGFPGEDDFAAALRGRVPGLVGFVVNVNTERTNRIFGRQTRTVWGRPYLVDVLAGLTFHVFATSFYQVNPAQTEVLYRKALAYAGAGSAGKILDAYSGIGTIALLLAREAGPRGADVLGLEADPGAVRDARRNAEVNGLGHVRFEAAAVEERLPRLVAGDWQPDVVVLDPPRAGAKPPVLDALAASGVPRVVYVSCNPATFARDAAALAAGGYALREVTPVDMFPQTAHVECVALLERSDVS